MKKFDTELAALHDRMAAMADATRSMVTLATSTVRDRTQDVRPEVAAREARVNQMQTEIDHEAVRLLTIYGPVAADLRYLLVVTHVTAQLERIGDQVVNICESLDLMQSAPERPTLPELQKMADLVGEVVDDALAAYFAKDAQKAETTRTHDDVVDALNAQIVKKLLSDDVLRGVLQGTEDIADALAQILVARHFERIADQAVNICKEVVYMVRGDDVRHLQKV
jgi:phosphate transport system protein